MRVGFAHLPPAWTTTGTLWRVRLTTFELGRGPIGISLGPHEQLLVPSSFAFRRLRPGDLRGILAQYLITCTVSWILWWIMNKLIAVKSGTLR